jgi:hypothetical protein
MIADDRTVRSATRDPDRSPRATVFAYLTDPEKILSWMGSDATTEPHPGGLYLLKGIGPRGGAAAAPSARSCRCIVWPTRFGWEGGRKYRPDRA